MNHFFPLKIKITFLCIFVSIAFSSIFLFSYYKSLRENLLESVISEYNDSSSAILKQMEHRTDQLFWLVNSCASNSDIVRFLKTDDSPSYTDLPMNIIASQALDQKYRETDIRKYINKIIVCSNDGRTIMTGARSGNLKDCSVIQNLPGFDTFVSSRQDCLLYTENDITIFSLSDYASFYYICPIRNPSRNQQLGWLYLSASPDIFTNILKLYPSLEGTDVFIKIYDNYFQYSGQTLSCYASGPFSDENNPFLPSDDSKSKTIRLSTENDSLSIGLNIPEISHLLPWNTFSYHNICLPILLIFFLIFSMYFFLSHWITIPLTNMVHHINDIGSGILVTHPELEKNNDFGQMEMHINQMTTSICQLMQKQLQDEKDRNFLENNILQNQINPHFIYNSLNTLKYMADMQNVPSISEMIAAMTDTFKLLAKNTAHTIPLSSELEFIEKYIIVQKYRYEDSFSFSIRISEPSLLDIPILKLSLQPIVENAIFHGISSDKLKNHIEITASSLADVLIIHVIDNGIGMTQEQISSSLEQSVQNAEGIFKKVGIGNVNKRMQLEYGTQFGVSISSIPGAYTDVKMCYPIEKNRSKE